MMFQILCDNFLLSAFSPPGSILKLLINPLAGERISASHLPAKRHFTLIVNALMHHFEPLRVLKVIPVPQMENYSIIRLIAELKGEQRQIPIGARLPICQTVNADPVEEMEFQFVVFANT